MLGLCTSLWTPVLPSTLRKGAAPLVSMVLVTP